MDSDDTQQPVVGEPAGLQLKRAREHSGLSVSEVADAQHLRPAIIEAIERADYQQIDSELFLKGYVRTYARQVGLDPDAVIATLDQELEPLRQQKVQAEEANPLVDIERRRRQKRRIAKLLVLVILIAALVVLGLRFMGEMTAPTGSDDEVSSDAEAGEEVPTDGAAEPGEAQDAVPEPDAEPADPVSEETEGESVSFSPIERVDGPSSEPSAAEVVAPDGPTETQSDAASEPQVSQLDDTGPDTTSVDASRVPVVTSSPEPAFEESAQPQAEAGNGRLEMTFRDECWVQVTDSAGNRLVGALQRDGDQVDVTGRLPIDVIVGAVDAIESIRFDGEPVDMADFRVVNNRTEFTLDI